jgi:ATP phosphoribosyltransferase
VADRAATLGYGVDLCESERPLDSRLDLGFGKCRLVVAVRDESPTRAVSDLARGSRVATVFPRITRAFFKQHSVDVEVVPVSGAAEIAPPIPTSSSTSRRPVRAQGEPGCEVQTSCCDGPPDRRAGRRQNGKGNIGATSALESVLRARGQRYLMANVPREALPQVKEVIPGLNGPTVIDIMNGGSHVAVHAVVPAATIYRTIASLKTLGAEGILVTRIERLMP